MEKTTKMKPEGVHESTYRPNHFLYFAAIGGMISMIFYCYLQTMSPSIAGGDSGEIVAEGCQLGVSHPPGYPLLTMLIYGIKSIDPSAWWPAVATTAVAYRVNVFSAMLTTFAAGCMGFVVATIRTNTRTNPCFVVGGIAVSMGMFCFSPLIWQYAVTAEVFPLNTAFAAFIVALVWQFSKSQSFVLVEVGAFVCGLALCNQHTIILYEVPLILWMLFLNRFMLMKQPMRLIKLGVLFLLGLTPYLYMPVIATVKPEPGSWGHVTTFSGFLHHFLRKDYGTFQLFSGNGGKPTESMLERNIAYAHDFWQEQGLMVSVVLVVAGLLLYRAESNGSREEKAFIEVKQPLSVEAVTGGNKSNGKQSKGKSASQPVIPSTAATAVQLSSPPGSEVLEREAKYTFYVLVFTQLFYFIVFHSLSNLPLDNKLLYGIHQRFWMQPNIITFLIAGIGYVELWNRLEMLLVTATTDSDRAGGPSRSSKSVMAKVLNVVALMTAASLVICQYRRNVVLSDQSDATYFRAYATALLGVLPQNATLLINYDQQWTSVRYMQRCEGFRTDVSAINLSMMTYGWFKHKHSLYPNLKFPGSYHGPRATKASKGTFTLPEFLRANKHVPVYLGGKLSVTDPEFDAQYDSVPEGLVSRLVEVSQVPAGNVYSVSVQRNMQFVMESLKNMPLENKYPEVRGLTLYEACVK
jgi:hypothetical protein